jgi:hypothetical protein
LAKRKRPVDPNAPVYSGNALLPVLEEVGVVNLTFSQPELKGLLALHQSSRQDPDGVVTVRFSLDELAEALMGCRGPGETSQHQALLLRAWALAFDAAGRRLRDHLGIE